MPASGRWRSTRLVVQWGAMTQTTLPRSDSNVSRARVVREAACFGVALFGFGLALVLFARSPYSCGCFDAPPSWMELAMGALAVPTVVLLLALVWHSSLAARLTPRLHLYALGALGASVLGALSVVFLAQEPTNLTLLIPGGVTLSATDLSSTCALLAGFALVAGAVWTLRAEPRRK